MFRDLLQTRLRLYNCLFIMMWITALWGQTDRVKPSVIFCGKIVQADSNQHITLRFYKDFLTFEEITYSAPIIKDSFYLEIPFKENMPGFIDLSGVNVPIFIEASDSIYVASTAKKFVDSLQYSGKGGLSNNYLQQTFLTFDVKDTKKIEDGRTKKTATDYQKLLSEYKQQKLDFLDTFLIKADTQFTKAFMEYVKADINYWWGQNLMRYRAEHPASEVLPISLNLSEEYFKFMDTLDLNNEAALNNVNYLFYLEQYTAWRQERIAKGKLQFKNVTETKKELVKVKMIETFGQVLIDSLEVRAAAHDELSGFAKLERGSEVLYLQDITNDRFGYPFQGKRYRDKFLKIELADGRIGWVFNGGINLKQKVVYTRKWVEIPDSRPELMRNFKYASFKGKVMHYAIAKDLYWDVIKNHEKDHSLLKDYLAKAEENSYTDILKSAYAVMEKDTSDALVIAKDLPIPQQKIVPKADSTKQILGLLKEITAQTATQLIDKKDKETATKEKPLETILPEEIVISPPDFSKYARITSIDGKTSRSTLNRPEIIINTNPLLREETTFPFPNSTETDFHFDVALKSSTTATIKLGKQSIDLYLQPSYDLNIAINGNDLYEGLSFTGKGSGINNYFVTAARLFKHIELELETNIRHTSPNDFKTFLKKVRTEKLQFLRTYLEGHTLSADVVKYAHANINYWYAFNLMNYPYEHPIFQNQPAPMEVPVDYYDFMEEVKINNASALPNKYYIYYLQDFLSFQVRKEENKGLSKFEVADKYLKGKPLYFYKALQHSVEIKRTNNAMAERDAYDFIDNCPYELYREFVKLAYHESRGIVTGMDAPAFNLLDAQGNSVSLSAYKGKVVFLDFWATWCKPCLRLVPAHQKLQAQFKSDNIVFLYVSTDRNATNWKNHVAKGTFPGKHVLANTKMIEQYKVETLPYSMLIDTNGKIVWHHLGGFSVQRTTQRILDLLQ